MDDAPLPQSVSLLEDEVQQLLVEGRGDTHVVWQE
jgi:hypothetical protein